MDDTQSQGEELETAGNDDWLDDGQEDFNQDEFALCKDEVLEGEAVVDLGMPHLLDLLSDTSIERPMARRMEDHSITLSQTPGGSVNWKFVLP